MNPKISKFNDKFKTTHIEEDHEGGGCDGKGTVEVMVSGLELREGGNEGIKVLLVREGEERVLVTNINGQVIFEEAKFGGNNILSVEDVEGYITPESKRVKINGKNKYVKESFQYEKDVEIPEDAKIISIENPDSIKVDLPNKVKATFDNNMKKDVTVIWNVKKEAELIGIVEGTDIQPKLSILVDEEDILLPEKIKLDKRNISLTIHGDEYGTFQLTATIEPEGSYAKSLIWSSSDETIATVDSNGLVSAKGIGVAIIRVNVEETDLNAHCSVSVAIDGSPLETETYILACLENGTQEEEFKTREDVFILGNNLKQATHYIKVQGTGRNSLLGSGKVDSSLINEEGDALFNLFDITNFKLTDKNSNEYFVFMSTYAYYPKDDEKTFKTNFKVEKPVPTGEIIVTNEFVGGDRIDKSGVKFILGRILFEDDPEKEKTEKYSDYLDESSLNGYNDEVKAWGITDENGKIEGFEIWDGVSELENGKWYAKEILKIGGYMLLQEPIDNYENNLEQLNPYVDDGSLLKEVHIERDTLVTREVLNIYFEE